MMLLTSIHADAQTQHALQDFPCGTGPRVAGHLSQGPWNHLLFIATRGKAAVAWHTDLETLPGGLAS